MATDPTRIAKVLDAMRRVRNEKRWYVLPEEGHWIVLREEAQKATRVLPSEREAVELARSLAEQAHGEVIIHHRDGTIKERQVVAPGKANLETVYKSAARHK